MPEGAEKKEFARKRKFLQDLTGNKSSGVKKIKREKDADAQVNKGNLRAVSGRSWLSATSALGSHGLRGRHRLGRQH